MERDSDVGGKRPRCRRPNKHVNRPFSELVYFYGTNLPIQGFLDKLKLHINRFGNLILILKLGISQRGLAIRAPGNGL